MKKSLLMVLLIGSTMILHAQQDSLYDVNYDKPLEVMQPYTGETEFFQQLYMQYESTIHFIETKVREEEKKRYQAELQQARAAAQAELLNAVSRTREDIYALEIEQVKVQAIDRLTAELTSQITEQLTAQFTVEYENKKNTEIAVVREELKKQIYADTNAGTERFKTVALYVAAGIAALGVFALILILIKNRAAKKLRQAQRNIKIQSYAADYFAKLKEFGGQTSVLTEELKKEIDPIERELKFTAFKIAQEKYSEQKHIQPIDQIRKDFDNLNPKSVFSKWNAAGDDMEMKHGLCINFNDNINGFDKKGREVWASFTLRPKNEQDEIYQSFNYYADLLERTAQQVTGLLVSCNNDESLKKYVSGIAQNYRELSKKFKKRSF